MRDEVKQAARHLAQVIAEENAALVALDWHRVGPLVTAKRLAIEALQALQPQPATIADDADAAPLAAALARLAAENTRLLEQAMMIQNRIMSLVAEAARRTAIPLGYGAGGRRPALRAGAAVALRSSV